MSPPRELAVVMPVHNGARFIGAAIASILAQTHDDFEFHIVDDGSTDGTLDVIRSFADPRLNVHVQPLQQGISRSLNAVLAASTARFMARMDADDIARPTRFALQLDYLRAHPGVVACGSAQRLFGDDFDARVQVFACNHATICARQLFNCEMSHPTVMLNLDVMRRHRLAYNVDATYGEDYDLWARASRVAPLHNLADVLLDNRQHPDQVGKRHATAQRATANHVRRYLLAAMGMDVSERELRLHCTYSTAYRLPADVSDGEGIRWFRKLARCAGLHSAFGIAAHRVCVKAIARLVLRGGALRSLPLGDA